MITQARFRLLIRSICLVVAVIFASQVLRNVAEISADDTGHLDRTVSILRNTPIAGLSAVFPAMSPFMSICSSLAQRSLSSALAILAVPILVMSAFRGRWFCRWMCPTGFVSEYIGKLSTLSDKQRRVLYKSWPNIASWLLVMTLGASLIGYPVFLWLDPLSMFNGFVNMFRAPVILGTTLLGIGFCAVIVVSAWRPNLWCYRCCPLGATQEWLKKAGSRIFVAFRRKPAYGTKWGSVSAMTWDRRTFFGLVLGGIVGATIAKFVRKSPIRPPGALAEGQFEAVCSRCGNCIGACPEKVLKPDVGEAGIAGLLAPVLEICPGYCAEWCNECGKACPTGAIRSMTLAQKRDISIGTARVARNKCLAWAQREYCLVCDEYCPFHAIRV
ncbi:MAG: 4Fe-4S binding protein, partial [Lentisphaerae bacterium]|nr:4Fe-4S binding protein [Lentisphaerota bacterium]